MLHVLLESGAPRHSPRAGWTLASVLTHAALVSTAVALTVRRTTPDIERVPLPDVIYIAPPSRGPAQTTPREPRAPRIASLRDIPPFTVPTVAPFRSTSVIDASVLVDPSAFGPGVSTASGDPEGTPRDGVHTANTVDRFVVPRADNPRPEYPPALRAASLEGDVLVQFVVDSTGRVSPAVITIVRANHEQFADAVRRWLPRTRYAPAQANGRPVAQLVQQQVGFSLRP
jgi:protein TonB